MPANKLKIAPGLSLDADYIAGASLALLGKRGSGKTYASRVLAEALFDAHVQTVVVDPMGVFWGLRSSADGEHDGLPIPVFGGEHGDAPLEPTAGPLMADLVVDEGLSMILDLSGFGSRTQERTFAAAFLDRLYRTNRELVHLVVDEADLFAPQKPRREDAHLLVTMENIVRRGRNKGIGITMASQRAAVLNKDVLTQIDGLVALRVAAPQDRDAIRDWVRGQGEEEVWSQIAPSLPGLANGECWWWIPEKGILKRVQVRKTRTFDSSPTRKRGSASRAPKTFADVDLDAISGRIAATIERAKATDPRELTKRIRVLERELAAARSEAAPKPQVVEIPVLNEDLLGRLESTVRALAESRATSGMAVSGLMQAVQEAAAEDETNMRSLTQVVDNIAAEINSLRSPEPSIDGQRRDATIASHKPEQVPRPPLPAKAVRHQPTASDANQAVDSAPLTPARERLLNALASLETIGVTRARKPQLALWAAVSPKSSGYANNLGALRSGGLIDYPAPGMVSLTEAGRAFTTEVSGEIVSDAGLQAKVRGLVSPARWRILAALIDTYPEAITKDDLAVAAGVSPSSSGFANNLGALRSLGLLDYPAPGRVAATELLFVEAR